MERQGPQQIPIYAPRAISMAPYPMPSQYAMPGPSSVNRQSTNLCPPERTLWMGSIDSEKWDTAFITEAFGEFGYQVQNVKMVTEKGSDRLASYCFVEFMSEEDARNVMLKLNGRTIRNDPERRRFNLSFANSPDTHAEFNIFVNNLSSSVDDVTLFKIFGEKYKSCRGAKVYRNPDGTSKKSGFVRFTSETDQQLALVEMNKVMLKHKEMYLKLAQPRGRNQMGREGRSSYPGNHFSRDTRGSTYSSRDHSSRTRHRSRSPRRSSPIRKPYFEPVDPPTVDEHNEHLFDTELEFQMALDNARFSKILIPADLKSKDLAVKLYGD